MIGRGNTVGDHLAIGFHEGQGRVDVYARPRHELSLEGVAVDVHNTRQHQEILGIEGLRAVDVLSCLGFDFHDPPFLQDDADCASLIITAQQRRIIDACVH